MSDKDFDDKIERKNKSIENTIWIIFVSMITAIITVLATIGR